MATYDLAYPGAAIDAILNTAYFLQEAGYIFQGSASEYSGTPSKRVWLIAPAGFTGLGLSSAVPQGSIGICLYNGTAWVGKVINVLTLDSQPTRNSQNGVTSGGVAATLDEIAGGIMATFASLLFDDETAAADLRTKLSYAVKFSVSDVYQTVTHLNILAATTSKAGLMSAEDKAKVDSFLTGIRSMQFVDATSSSEQAIKLVEQLKWTVGGVQEVIDSITLLAATSSKAGLLSAADKAYIDALPATLTSLSNSISGALALMKSLVGYYVCDTAAGTAAKTVSASGYVLTNGGCIRIKMTNANTANSVTLNINSTGAKALYYDGAQASSSNSWEAGDVLEVFYDGTQYQCASGGGGKFATGQRVMETSIANEIISGSADLPTSDAVYNDTPSNKDTGTNTDLEISDEQNNVLLRLAGGGIKTKNFDSDIDAPLRSGDSGYDLEISDEQNNILLRLAEGGIKTKNFDSSVDAPLSSGDSDYDLEISDEQNNVLLRLAGGGIKTKNFDSDDIEPSGYAKKKVIKYLAVGNSVNQDAACYIPYLLRKLYGDDIDFEIGIAYRAGYTIKDYVQRIITGLDNLHIFSHAKNSMVLINENNKSFDYAINFSDWDIVSFQMYQAPDKTEDVSYAPMLLDYLKHNTKNGCKFGLVTPATYAGSTYRDAYIGFQQDILTSCALDFMLDYGATKEFFIINGMTVDTSTDNVHTDDGFGCEALALTAVHLLSDIYGLDDRASNIDTPVTQVENTAINVAGSNGSFQTTTDENWRKCVDAALQGWRTGCASYSLANNTLRLRTFNT